MTYATAVTVSSVYRSLIIMVPKEEIELRNRLTRYFSRAIDDLAWLYKSHSKERMDIESIANLVITREDETLSAAIKRIAAIADSLINETSGYLFQNGIETQGSMFNTPVNLINARLSYTYSFLQNMVSARKAISAIDTMWVN